MHVFGWHMRSARRLSLTNRMDGIVVDAVGGSLAKSILFVAAVRGSPSIDEQRDACAEPDDLIVEAGRLGLTELAERLARKGLAFTPGDTLKIYDLSCIAISTNTLVRVLTRTLEAGVSIRICRPGIVIAPGSEAEALITLLDQHWRFIHGMKTHDGAKAKTGRKPVLVSEQLPHVRDLLAKTGATTASVARELGVGRTSLFAFLKRHGLSARRR